jgi:hypothetical protein
MISPCGRLQKDGAWMLFQGIDTKYINMVLGVMGLQHSLHLNGKNWLKNLVYYSIKNSMVCPQGFNY